MRPLARATLYGLVLAALWLVLAWTLRRTYHLAPLLVAAVVPLGVAMAGKQGGARLHLAGAAAGACMALATTAVLALGGRLGGPSILPSGGAVAEAVAFSLAGALIGLVLAAAGRRR